MTDVTVCSRFMQQAESTPNSVALSEDPSTTYRDLLVRVRRLAARLGERSLPPQARVGVFLRRPSDCATAVLAVLSAGCVVVPLDTTQPVERLARVSTAAGLGVVIADEPLRFPLPLPLSVPVLSYASSSAADASTGDELPRAIDPRDLAFLYFTSGSTGEPKGVLIPHGALLNRIRWGQTVYPLSSADIVLQSSAMSYDFSSWELLAPLCTGAALAFLPRPLAEIDGEQLAETLEREQITAVHFVPSLFRTYLPDLSSHGGFGRVRYVYFGGEALSGDLLRHAARLFPFARIFNQYGPTETCIDSAFWEARTPAQAADGPVPIGEPIADTVIRILDERLEEVPAGTAGEICIGGAGLAWGYDGDPSGTAERFVPDPNPGVPGARLYRSGDIGRSQVGGCLEYIGRSDGQISAHGVRVESGEVAAAIQGHPDIRQAAVVPVRLQSGEQLAAFVVVENPRDGDDLVTGLRHHLERWLPSAVIPRIITPLTELPRQASGKVDMARLRELAAARRAGTGAGATPEHGEPPTVVEQRLAEIWRELLDVAHVSPGDSFFDLGGHSLLALRLRARIRQLLGVQLNLKDLLTHKTMRDLARQVAAQLSER